MSWRGRFRTLDLKLMANRIAKQAVQNSNH
jgi:hypothetical protein